MASIHKEKRGDKTYYRLQFYDKDDRRRSIRLGDVNRRSADAIRVKVEDLLSASIAGNTPSNETSRWLSDIGKDLAAKLTTAGFGKYIPKRESAAATAAAPPSSDNSNRQQRQQPRPKNKKSVWTRMSFWKGIPELRSEISAISTEYSVLSTE